MRRLASDYISWAKVTSYSISFILTLLGEKMSLCMFRCPVETLQQGNLFVRVLFKSEYVHTVKVPFIHWLTSYFHVR